MRLASTLPPLLATAALIASCAPESTAPPPSSVVVMGDTLQLRRFRDDGYPLAWSSGMKSPERLVIHDEATWRATWAQIWEPTSPQPALPAVDFAREMVVVASLGQRGSGGYAIRIEEAIVTGDDIVIRVHAVSPGDRCFTTASLTQPVDAAVVPRSAGTVRFVESASVTECR